MQTDLLYCISAVPDQERQSAELRCPDGASHATGAHAVRPATGAASGARLCGRCHAAAAAVWAVPVLMGVSQTAVACCAVACNADHDRNFSSRVDAALVSLNQISALVEPFIAV